MEIYEKYNLMDKPRVLIVMKSVMTKKNRQKNMNIVSLDSCPPSWTHNALRSTGFQFVGTSVCFRKRFSKVYDEPKNQR